MQTGDGHSAGCHPAHMESRAPAALGLTAFFFLTTLLQWGLEAGFLQPARSDFLSAQLHWPELCSLRWPLVHEGEWWRILAYCTAHPSYAQAVLSILGIYAVARAVEPIVGTVQVLCAALVGVITGALTSFALGATAGMAIPDSLGPVRPPVPVGATEAPGLQGALPLLASLVGVYSTILPGWRIGAASFLKVQFPLSAGAFGWLTALGCALWWATGWFPEAGPAPMLGGLLSGCAFARLLGFGGLLFTQRNPDGHESRGKQLEEMDWEEFLRTELNPVLDKISTQGIHSLTRAEWKILQQSRRKLEGW